MHEAITHTPTSLHTYFDMNFWIRLITVTVVQMITMSHTVEFVSISAMTSIMTDIIGPNSIHIEIQRAGFEVIDASWNYDLYLRFWRLYRNNENGAMIQSHHRPDRQHRLQKNHIYLIPPLYRCQSSCDSKVNHLHMTFNPIGLHFQWVHHLISEPIDLGNHDLLTQQCDLLQVQIHQISASLIATSICSHALSLWIEDLSHGQKQLLQRHLTHVSPLNPAIMLIETQLSQTLLVSDLSAACALSPDYFSKLFYQEFGITPARYVTQRRITQASELLRHTQLSIDHIADQCGFTNRFHFSRVFKQLLGQPPAGYRKQQQQ